MGLDVKVPIGLVFTILGILLLVYGFSSDPAIYARSLGVNINLRWGGFMLVFGIAMLLLSLKRKRGHSSFPNSDSRL